MDFFDQTFTQGTILFFSVSAIIILLVHQFFPWLIGWICRPVIWVGRKAWNWIAPRNPFSIALRSYHKHISRSHLSMIENPVGPVASIPLERAFTPLRLLSQNQRELIELFPYAATQPRTIVLGGPGTGKTTLMKHLIIAIIRDHCHPDLNGKIPVFVILRELASKNQTIEEAVVDAFAAYHFPGAQNFVRSALDQGRTVIVLDGLDEVGTSRSTVVQRIQSFCEYDDQREHKNHVLVTCRENSYRTEDLRMVLPNVIRVEPFSNHHMRLFLKGWPEYHGRVALQLYGELQNFPEIQDACRNPLLLSILTGLYLETENFAIPQSRNRFYKACIDELLVKRPARRGITLDFTRDDKLAVLQRVSLDRLESVQEWDDAEAFQREMILCHAEKVLNRSFDRDKFIYELVHVHGILKPTEDQTFTCSHRTIQEYLAAREARRQRTASDVLDRFGHRPDLFEVLLFYCGIIDNIPLLEGIITYFAEKGDWRQAGECLLNMMEVPSEALINQVTAGLHKRIVTEKLNTLDGMRIVEILAALSQRPQPEFTSARSYFPLTIDLLTTRLDGDTSVLEAALTSDPETAMRLVPGLLDHPSPQWQQAAVRLLRDTSSPEALVQLVLLLKKPAAPVRTEAGCVLADLLKTHGDELTQYSLLMPERQDRRIWPLEDYFPGRLALPIIEAVADTAPIAADRIIDIKATDGIVGITGNQAIDVGIQALMATQHKSRNNAAFLRQWHRIPRDIKLAQYRQRCGTVSLYVAFVAIFLGWLAIFGIASWCLWTNKVLVWPSPLQIKAFDAKPLQDVRQKAKSVVSEITNAYPPNAGGWARILPWNWLVEPAVPESSNAAFEHLQAIAGLGYLAERRILNAEDVNSLLGLQIPATTVKELTTAIEALPIGLRSQATLPAFAASAYTTYAQMSLFAIVLQLPLYFTLFSSFRKKGLPIPTTPAILPTVLMPILILLLASILSLGISLRVASLITALSYLCIVFGFILRNLNWPYNPLKSVVNDVPSCSGPQYYSTHITYHKTSF